MKKILIIASAAIMSIALHAQSAIDAYNLSQQSLRGTARFMSMGGAFTALGGDLSSLNQNPAGIGVYRSSEIGITLDLNVTSTKSSGIDLPATEDKTYFNCNNIGYVGTFNLGEMSPLKTLSWGISFNRSASLDRIYSGGFNGIQTSLSNYVASYSRGVDPNDLAFDNGYNPYLDSNCDWLAILSRSALMINPIWEYNQTDGQWYQTRNYTGLFQYGKYDSHGNQLQAPTSGYADFYTREKGYVDEYSIDFGGNVSDIVMWGVGIGITDLSFTQESYWYENMENALISNSQYNDTELGHADFDLYNFKHTTGSGVNIKLGVIVKPIPELRLGFAVHTPTWYSLTTEYNADVYANYSSFDNTRYEYTDVAHYDWHMKSPWKMMFGVAGVIGGRGIVSLDYERTAYNNMTVSDDSNNEYREITAQVKAAYQASNTIRLGAEYRLTPQISLRAGYSYASSSAQQQAIDQDVQVVSYDTNAAYTLNNSTNTFSLGAGYRYQGFYCDLAYMHLTRKADFYAYTPYADANDEGYWTEAPHAKLTDNSNQIVLSLGYKF